MANQWLVEKKQRREKKQRGEKKRQQLVEKQNERSSEMTILNWWSKAKLQQTLMWLNNKSPSSTLEQRHNRQGNGLHLLGRDHNQRNPERPEKQLIGLRGCGCRHCRSG